MQKSLLSLSLPDKKCARQVYGRHVVSCSNTWRGIGNPSMEESKDVMKIKSKVIMPEDVIKAMKNIHPL